MVASDVIRMGLRRAAAASNAASALANPFYASDWQINNQDSVFGYDADEHNHANFGKMFSVL